MSTKFHGTVSAPLMYRITSDVLLRWTLNSASELIRPDENCVYYALPKRASSLIDRELQNKKLAKLGPMSPLKAGLVRLTEERTLHVVESREKDGLKPPDVVELLGCFFGNCPISYAPNRSSGPAGQGYSGQIVAFSSSYRTRIPAVNGQAPCAILQFEGSPFPHLKLETAYWIQAQKIKALEKSALK